MNRRRLEAERLDAADPLRAFRGEFVVSDPALIYLDGNSLGRLPRATAAAVERALRDEWGRGLVTSWGEWKQLPGQIGDTLAPLIGAGPGEVLLSDQTSINLYKLAGAALTKERPDIVTDDSNFPSDLYVLGGVAAAAGGRLRVVAVEETSGIQADDVASEIDDRVGLVSHAHVAYRSGALADMASITEAAHEAGALALWDLSHSVGVIPVNLTGSRADLAVGCTYKYLNGGPGAPAFLYVRRGLHKALLQPIRGWWSHADMFGFTPAYAPADGIGRFAVGTPPILSLVAARVGIELSLEAGLDRIRAKSASLTGSMIAHADRELASLGFTVITPRAHEKRGSHIALRHTDAYRITLALRDRKVITDFRAPDTIRLGAAPLYTSHVEVHEALSTLRDLVAAGEHERYEGTRSGVT